MKDEERAREAAAKAWNVAPGEVQLKDITRARFAWARQHRFFMAMNREKARLLIVQDRRTERLLEASEMLPPSDACLRNIGRCNAILMEEAVDLPAALDLPWTLRNVLYELGGWVAGLRFLSSEESAIHMWTHLDPLRGPALFRGACAEPVTAIEGDRWSTEFRYFNWRGGVEHWLGEGDRTSVHSVSAKTEIPDHTFLVPYA